VKRLGLFRHAKSDWDDLTLRDFDRGLNDRGRRGAALMGRHILDQGVAWDLVLASPAERVRRTLEASGLPFPVHWDEHAYLAGSGGLIELLCAIEGDPQSVLLAGHNPGLQDLIFALVAPAKDEEELFTAAAEKYPTASFAVLELAIEQWSGCAPGCGRLVHFARPRDLDPGLGPEPADRSAAELGR
jgi:phosphohistidine phosphatase